MTALNNKLAHSRMLNILQTSQELEAGLWGVYDLLAIWSLCMRLEKCRRLHIPSSGGLAWRWWDGATIDTRDRVFLGVDVAEISLFELGRHLVATRSEKACRLHLPLSEGLDWKSDAINDNKRGKVVLGMEDSSIFFGELCRHKTTRLERVFRIPLSEGLGWNDGAIIDTGTQIDVRGLGNAWISLFELGRHLVAIRG